MAGTAVADNTVYPGDKPDYALGRAFAKNIIPAPQRIALVAHLQTAHQVATLGEDPDTFKNNLRALLHGTNGLPDWATAPGIALLARWVAVWDECKEVRVAAAQELTKIKETPLFRPQLGAGETGSLLSQFGQAHPDIILMSSTRPSKSFIETLRREAGLGIDLVDSWETH